MNSDNDLVALPLGLKILRVLDKLRESVLAKQTRLVQPRDRLSLFLTTFLAIAVDTVQCAATTGLAPRRGRLGCRDTGAHFCTDGAGVACVRFAAERVEVERRSEFLETVVHVV
jgi:hypothetical protein